MKMVLSGDGMRLDIHVQERLTPTMGHSHYENA